VTALLAPHEAAVARIQSTLAEIRCASQRPLHGWIRSRARGSLQWSLCSHCLSSHTPPAACHLRARTNPLLLRCRNAQKVSAGALAESRSTLSLSKAAEDLQHAVGYCPIYTTRAQAAAKEMRALRARVDRALQRAATLEHAAKTGEVLVPSDLGAFVDVAAGITTNVTSGLTTSLSGSLASLTGALFGGERPPVPPSGVMPPPALPPGTS
jgi:hypothetical protein